MLGLNVHIIFFQGNCDFDSGHMCFWRNNVNFNFEWTLRRYSTPNGLTGPNEDHTSGTVQKKKRLTISIGDVMRICSATKPK